VHALLKASFVSVEEDMVVKHSKEKPLEGGATYRVDKEEGFFMVWPIMW
jgi:hypothetical protein